MLKWLVLRSSTTIKPLVSQQIGKIQIFNGCILQPVKVSNIAYRNYSKSQPKGIFKGFSDAIKTKSKRPKLSEIRRLLLIAKPEKWKIIGAIGLLVISSTVSMLMPFSMGKVVDLFSSDTVTLPFLGEVSSSREDRKETLNNVCMFLFGAFMVGGVANFGRIYLIRTSGQRIIQRVRSQLFTSLLSQETAFFDRAKTGELLNRLSTDTTLMGEALTMNISDGLRSSAQAVGGIGMMLSSSYEKMLVSPKLTLISMAIVPPMVGSAIIYGRYVRKITARVQDALAQATQVAEERLGNIRTVRAFGQELRESNLYTQETQKVLQLSYKESKARALFFGATGLSGNVMILSVLYYGGLMMHEAQMTIGSLTAFIVYAAYVGISISGVSSFYTELMRSLGASTRIWELIDRQPRIKSSVNSMPHLAKIPSLKGDLRFQSVSFSYPSRQESSVLANLSLDVPNGSVLAVVGASGSGKSTLFNLILRHYDPDQGTIMIDGQDLRDIDIAWWRSQIGSVPQDPVLFSCSVRENIAYGSLNCDEVSLAEIEEAARKANALQFIQNLPQGFDTLVGERGVLLSGGQRQRISIARAIIKDPKILLLDEATSALDSESERLVQCALSNVVRGRTVLTIAHRLSTIVSANQIAVLTEEGCVAELGTYNELMSRGSSGIFRRLVENQMFEEAPQLKINL